MTNVHGIQEKIFNIVIIINYVLYFIIIFGISINAPDYLSSLDYYVKMYISGFLLLRFNPFRKVEFTELDRKIVFSAAIFIFTTTAINSLLITYLKKIKGYFFEKSNNVYNFIK
jgi:hypothetical protein